MTYLLIFFATGKLPWQSVKNDSMEVMFEEVKRLKIGLSNAEVCCGRAGKPYWITHNVFLAFILPLFNYVSELEFDSTPNY